jgi:hypothetical protein
MTLVLALLVLAVSIGCNNGGGASPDGSTDTGTTDADADADSDGDGDSDSDTDTWITDAGPWDWEPLPEMEDCGLRCQRLTGAGEVQSYEWDVWDTRIVYLNTIYQLYTVDWMAQEALKIPDLSAEFPVGEDYTGRRSPVIYSSSVFFTEAIFTSSPKRIHLVVSDLDAHVNTVIATVLKTGEYMPHYPQHNDFYLTRQVSRAGCDPYSELLFCSIDVTHYSEASGYDLYSTGHSIWGEVAVRLRLDTPSGDIGGYRVSTGEFFDITDDDEYQLSPRIWESLVVYQDLRLGDSTPEGDWNHSSIWLYDLDSEQTVQITDGSSVAIFPDVFGNIVIWSDYRHCADPQNKALMDCAEIYGKNLVTDVEFKITDHPGWAKQPPPRIWGDKVFVHMYPPSGGSALFLFDLPPEAR